MPGFLHPPESLKSPPDRTYLDPPYLYPWGGGVERALDLGSQFGHGDEPRGEGTGKPWPWSWECPVSGGGHRLEAEGKLSPHWGS